MEKKKSKNFKRKKVSNIQQKKKEMMLKIQREIIDVRTFTNGYNFTGTYTNSLYLIVTHAK